MITTKPLPEALVLTPDFPPEIGGIQLLIARIVGGLTRYRPFVVTVAADGARGSTGGRASRWRERRP